MSQQLPAPTTADAGARIVALRSQYPDELLGVPRTGLRLTWRASAASAQIGYQVRWNGADIGAADPVASDDAIGIVAPGPALQPGEERRYAVRIATEAGWSPWSEELVVEASVDPAALEARPIGGSEPVEGPVMLLRAGFSLPAAPVRARLRATFWGVGELRINGRQATDEHLAPGWTAYQERIVLGTWDVTDLLHQGDNALGALLGDGWYRGRLGWEDGTEQYGTELAALVQLDVECADGSSVRVATSPDWTTSTGGIRSASLYDGVEIDLRAEPHGWDAPGFDDSAWSPVREVGVDISVVDPRITTGVRTVAEWSSPIEPRDGHAFIDLGQNIAGWLRLVVRGTAGDRVEVRHAEVLEPDGSIHTRRCAPRKATDGYVLAHDGETTLEPTFTFHGFQYAEVTGAEVVSADGRRRSRAPTSALVVRMRGPASRAASTQTSPGRSATTSCRSPPTARSATSASAGRATRRRSRRPRPRCSTSRRSGCRGCATSSSTRTPTALSPPWCPNILKDPTCPRSGEWETMGRAGWADAATIVPWAVYESYGSDEVLVRQLDSMRRWVASLERRAGDGLLPTEFQFGDWLDPDAPGDQPWRRRSRSDYVANAFFAHSRAAARATPSDSSATPTAPTPPSASPIGSAVQPGSAGATRRSRPRRAPRSPSSSPSRPRPSANASATAWLGTCGEERGRIATGFLGTPLVLFALVHSATSTRRTSCCCASRRHRGCTRSRWVRRRCGSGGTRSRPTAASTPATMATDESSGGACSRSTTTPTAP